MSSLIDITTVIAQATKPQAGLGPFTMVGMMIFMFGFIYFFSIRPQKQKEKKHQEEVSKLKKGDSVMLESGIYGEIFSVETDSMHVKIADKTIIKVHPRGVRVILGSDSAAATKEEV
ncbi:MAG: preprotein translocase subunit YajC [Lentisphaeraceae bacterium]|nr:preprotein translocase subunit YajC [Lentisphaeraceae bacterium]